MIPYFGMCKFSSITTEDIETLIDDMAEKGLSHSSIKKAYDLISNIYKYDLSLPPEKRASTYNPCANAVIQRDNIKKHKELKIFSQEETDIIKKELA